MKIDDADLLEILERVDERFSCDYCLGNDPLTLGAIVKELRAARKVVEAANKIGVVGPSTARLLTAVAAYDKATRQPTCK